MFLKTLFNTKILPNMRSVAKNGNMPSARKAVPLARKAVPSAQLTSGWPPPLAVQLPRDCSCCRRWRVVCPAGDTSMAREGKVLSTTEASTSKMSKAREPVHHPTMTSDGFFIP